MRIEMRVFLAALALAITAVAASVALAQRSAQAERDIAGKGQGQVAAAIAADFAVLAGGRDNALALVTALRSGGEARLVSDIPPAPGTPAGTEVVAVTVDFTPATRPMAWDEVIHVLALARELLAREGVSHPGPAQLQAAVTAAARGLEPARQGRAGRGKGG